MKMKVVAFKFLAKIARNVACLSAFFALSASAETVAKVGEASSIDLDAFITALKAANYNFDGSTHKLAQDGKLTVKWSPVSGCFDNREGHTCTVDNVKATGNTPKWLNNGLLQFQMFEGESHAVHVKNVAFVYEPADVTICLNSEWAGKFTANQAPAGQLYFMNTGDVAFENCFFDKVVLTSFNCTGASTVKDCSFKNVYNNYAVKDIRGGTIAVTGCTFEDCGAAVMVSAVSKESQVSRVTISGNTFKNVDVASTAAEGKAGTRGLVQIADEGDYASADFDFSDNKATDCGPVLRQLNTTVQFGAEDKTQLNTLVAAGGSLYTTDSVQVVASVGKKGYESLDAAIAALSAENYTLTLRSEEAWPTATPVRWTAGTQSGSAATLTAALTAGYKANAGAITIVCRPGADVGTMTHGHVEDDLTIYGNDAYLSGDECDLEVDTYPFSRATGAEVKDGAFLTKGIAIVAYELDNLGVWGERHTSYTVSVTLTDCDGKALEGKENVQRVYISGTTGRNDITLTGCDFLTKKTAVYSNADGTITATDCTFTGGAAPFNINHKADGEVIVTVEGCTFTNCGDAGDWKQFAAPVRFVNSGKGTMTADVASCEFSETVGANGDILLGDGRADTTSNDVTLKVSETAATVQAQKPGYYVEKTGETADTTKGTTTTTTKEETLETSVEKLLPTDPRTLGYATSGVAAALPAAPDMGGAVVNVTAAQAQYVLDGAYGSIDGKTINFTESVADTLVLGRASKYAGSGTLYRHGSHDGEAMSYADFIAYKNQATWTESCYYERTVENVTFTAGAGVIVNFTAEGGAQIYGKESAPVYDYVRDTGTWIRDTNNSFYKRAILKNITFQGLTFKAKTNFETSEPTTVYDGFTFTGCTFETGSSTAAGNYALRYYNENNNGSVKNLVVENCAFENCYQGIYTHNVKGITVKNCSFDTTGHNAIAIQSHGGKCDHGAVVIMGNKFKNIGDRIIRFNEVGTGTTITISDNTADENSGGKVSTGKREIVAATSLPENAAEIITASNNDWGANAVVEDVFADTKPVAATIGAVSYETLDSAITAVKDGETVVVNAGEYKLTGSQSIYTGKAFTIKAAEGATVSFDMSKVVTLGGAKITFEGVTFDYKTNGNYIGLQHADTLVYNDCTINGMVFLYAASETFNRCTFNQSSDGAYNVWTYGAKKVAFNACTFSCAGRSVLVYNESPTAKTDLTVASCTFNASAGVEGKAAIEIDTSLMVEGGASVAIDGETTATGFATGSNSGSALWNDKKQTKDTNKNVTVTVAGETVFAPVVAKIGETGYASLVDALAAAKDGDTVKMLADVNNADYTVANVIDVSLASGVTLDGNGKTLSGNVKVTVASAGGVTIKNVLFKDIHNAAVVSADAKEKYGFGDAKVGTLSAVYAPKLAGSLTVTGCTFENCDWEALQITPAEGAKIDIRENVFKTSASDLVTEQLRHLHIEMAYGKEFDYEGTDIEITVTDNQFLGGAKDAAAGIWWVGKASVLALSGNYYAEPDTVSITLSDGKNRTNRCDLIYPARSQADVDVDDLMASALVVHDDCNASAYSTLAEAIAVAKASETVRLLADVTVTEPVVIEKAITLDLDGKTVTSTWAMPSGALGDGRYAFLVRADATVCNGTLAAGQARALGAYASLTLTKATVTSALTGGHCCVAFCADGGHYTVTGATISGDYAIANFANNATVVIANSVLEGSGCGLYHNGQNFGLKMTVTDSTVNGAIDSSTIAEGRDPSGVYVSGSETVIGNEKNQNGVGKYHQVTFVRCTIKGNTGVEVKYTDLCLEDCTVEATTQTPSYKGNNDGMATLGFAVVATDNSKGTTPKPAGSITITGEKGSYTGLVGLGALASVKETFADFEDTANIAISGGTFSTAVLPDYCAAGFIPTANGNGTFGVKEGAYVAAIGEVKYETLAEAIAAAKASKTVMLIADTRENVIIDKGLTLDLNGFTLNGGTVKGKAALTVNGGSVTIKDSSEAQTGTIKREDTAENSGVTSYYVLDIQGEDGFVSFEGGTVVNNSGTTGGTRNGASLVRIGDDSVSAYPLLTIKGGTFTQDNFVAIKVDRGAFYLLGGTINCPNDEAVKNWGKATIKGGTVNGTVASWVYADSKASSSLTISDDATVNGNVYAMSYDGAEGKTATVSITGGYVTGELGTYQGKNIHDKTALSDAEKASIGVTGGRFTKDPSAYLVEGSIAVKGEDGIFSVQRAPLARIGDTYYYTMDDAFHAANASEKIETIVLLRDYTTPKLQYSGSKGFTLDLNGKTWTCTGSDAISAAFEINYSDVTLTVKNGKIVSNQLLGLIPSAMSGTITYDNAALVFEDVEATVNGRSGIETNGNNTNDAITLKGCTLTVANGYGIYFPSSGTLTIEDSVIVAKTMGVQVCAGSLNITGASKLTVTGDAVSKVENDGAIEDGAAVSVVSRTGYKGLEKIVLSGGTFMAKDGNAAFKAYAWANGVESAFDNTTATIAISGGTFSSAVLPQYCAAGYEPVKNADNTYGVKATFTIATVKKSAASDETIDIRVPYVLLEKVAGETQAEKVANLNKADANGNLAWVNLVAGIGPAKKVTMTAPQNDKPDVIDVGLSAVGTAPEGTDVTVRYEIRAEGSEVAGASATAAEGLVINLNGKEGIGTYRAYVCLLQNGTEVARVASENKLGVLQTVRAAKKTIIAVPWLSLTDGNAIAVADLVKTAGLTASDKLHVYNKAADRYDVYELTADKAWAPKAIYKVGADGTVATASSGTPETTTVARGSGVWIERQNTTQPIVSYGAVASATVATTLDAGTKEKPTWHLLAVPTTTAIDIATTFGTSETDEIIVPTDGSPKIFRVKGGEWWYEQTVSVLDQFGNKTGVRVDQKAEAELPAGTGFWYLNGGAAKTVNW